MEKIIEKLHSKDKDKINEAIKEIKDIPRVENKKELKKLISLILAKYNPENNDNVKATIRGINACLYFGIPVESLKRYKEILIKNVLNKDGTVRRTINSVMDSYRSIFLISDVASSFFSEAQVYSEKELEELKKLNVDSYVGLIRLYERQADEKIKSSILSSIKRFHCPAFYDLIAKTQHKELYEKYAQPDLPPFAFNQMFDVPHFVPLSKLLKKDTDAVKNIKSLYRREEKYSSHLSEVEYSIAEYFYYENRRIKDKQVQEMLKKIKKHYLEDIDFFRHPLERSIISALSEVLQEEPITHHELRLVFDYIMWAIDNRNWMRDEQAYLKWAAFAQELYNEQETREYEKKIYRLGKKLGMPKKAVDSVLLKDKDYKIDKVQEELSKLESEFFSMDRDEKLNFLLEKGTYFPNLIDEFLCQLKEEGDYKTINKFYNQFIEVHSAFIPIYLSMAGVYQDKNPVIAKHYLETGVDELERTPGMPKEIRKGMKKELERFMEEIGKQQEQDRT